MDNFLVLTAVASITKTLKLNTLSIYNVREHFTAESDSGLP